MTDKKQTTTEIALDILAFAHICVRCGFEDSVKNCRLFVEMCNEAGFRTARGQRFTYMGFRQMFARMDDDVKKKALEEFGANDIEFSYVGYGACEDVDVANVEVE